MSIDVTVLRVFTDSAGNFGNPLGVVDAATVEPDQRQRLAAQLGYSETVFVDLPAAGSATAHARIYTPLTELPFAGHPTVGASWWLRAAGTPIRTLQVPAGVVQVSYDDDVTAISARSEWAPGFAIHDLEVLTTSPRPTRPTSPTMWRTTCGHGSTSPPDHCALGCSPPIWVWQKTKRRDRPLCGSPTTSAAT